MIRLGIDVMEIIRALSELSDDVLNCGKPQDVVMNL